MMWGEPLIAPMVCVVGTGGLGLSPAWQTCQTPPLPGGELRAGHHGARIQSCPSSTLRCRRMGSPCSIWSLQPSLSGFQLAFQLGLRNGDSWGIFSLSFTQTLIPALPSPWSYSLPAARLEEDLLQHWNALQSLPPSLEIFGVRGHKSQ